MNTKIEEYTIRQKGSKYQVVGHTGKIHGTHPSKAVAQKQIAAIYSSKDKKKKKTKKVREVTYSQSNVTQNLSSVFEYLLATKFETSARRAFLSPNTEESAKMLRRPNVQKQVFSYLAGSLLKVVGDSMTEVFTRRFGMDKSEFNKYLNMNQILTQLGASASKPTINKSSTPSKTKVANPSGGSGTEGYTYSAKIGEALDEFDPDEKSWLQTQMDKIEKENAEMALPDAPTDKEAEAGLEPIDSRDQQVLQQAKEVLQRCKKIKVK